MTTQENNTVNIPVEYCGLLIPSKDSLNIADPTRSISKALKFIAHARPLDDTTTDDYEDGRHLLIDLLSSMAEYAETLRLNNHRESRQVIDNLSQELSDYKRFNELQSIMNNPGQYLENSLKGEQVESMEFEKDYFNASTLPRLKKEYETLTAKMGISDQLIHKQDA